MDATMNYMCGMQAADAGPGFCLGMTLFVQCCTNIRRWRLSHGSVYVHTSGIKVQYPKHAWDVADGSHSIQNTDTGVVTNEKSGTVQAAHPGCFLFCPAFGSCHTFLACVEAVLQSVHGNGILAAGPYDDSGLLPVLGLFAAADLRGLESGVPAHLPYRIFTMAGPGAGGSADLLPDCPFDKARHPSGASGGHVSGPDSGSFPLGRRVHQAVPVAVSPAARRPGVRGPYGGGADEEDQHAGRPVCDRGGGTYLRGDRAD